MLEVSLDIQQPAAVINYIMVQTSKPELPQYLHAALLIPTAASLIKTTKESFLKTWPRLTKNSLRGIFKNQGKRQWDTCT